MHKQPLTSEVTIPNNGIDLFVVLHPWPNSKDPGLTNLGVSPRPGPCNKYDDGILGRFFPLLAYMTGSVMSLGSGLTGNVIAHELGHYLGLVHRTNNPNNLMFPSADEGSHELDFSQGETMRRHCFSQSGCSGN